MICLFQKFERIYNEQLRSSVITQKAQFEYAWCLVRSKYPADIRKGIMLLEDLYCNHNDSEKRDCLYYLAIGNARIKVWTFTSLPKFFKINSTVQLVFIYFLYRNTQKL